MFRKFPGDPRLYKIKKKILLTKNTVFCMNTENGLKCSYSRRIDHFNKDIEKGKFHECTFNQKEEDPLNITQFMEKMKDGEDVCLSPNFLLDTLVKTAGKLNISIEAGRSAAMYELIQAAAGFGASIAVHGDSTTFEELFPRPSKDEFRRRFISISQEIWRNEVKKFSKYRYCCLAVDAGTTRRTPYLDFVLHHSMMGMSYIFKTLKMEGTGDTNDYREALSSGIMSVARAKCCPSTIIVDGQTAQNKALSKRDPLSIYKINPAPGASEHTLRCFSILHNIIKIPCLCHRVSNAYKSAVSKMSDISSLLNRFRSSANFIKSVSDKYGISCPTFVSTRWIYDFDIINYFSNKKEQINNILRANGKLPFSDNDYLAVKRVVEVFRALENILGDPSVRLSSAFQIIEDACGTLNAIFIESEGLQRSFANCSKMELLKYTLDSKDGGLWHFAFSLTPRGLDDIIMRDKNLKHFNFSADDFKVKIKE